MANVIFERAQHDDLPKIVDIYNQAIPGRMATADTEPVIVESKEAWFQEYNDSFPMWVINAPMSINVTQKFIR